MSDSPQPLYDFGLVAGFAAGVTMGIQWLWKKTRPNDFSGSAVIVTPAAVLDAVTKLHQDHELSLQEMRVINPLILDGMHQLREELGRVRDRLERLERK